MHYDGTLIVVSHDRDFLTGSTELVYEVTPTGSPPIHRRHPAILGRKASDTIAAYEAGRTDGPQGIPGGKDTKETKKAKTKAASKEDGKQAYENQKLVKKLKNKISKREKEIAELEAQEVALNEEMINLDPENRMATVAKAQEYEQLQTALQKALDDWEAATNQLETLEG